MRSYHRQKGKVSFIFYLDAFFFLLPSFLLARPFSTVLSRNDRSRHPCLVPDLWQSIQSFIIKYGVSYGFFVDALEQMKISFCS